MTLETIDAPEHFVLPGVSWDYYEQTLAQIGDGSTRVAFLDGVIEFMSPLPEHDSIILAVGQLITVLVMERQIPSQGYGSATFRSEEKAAGAEPDGCFYFHEIDSVKAMKKFDPKVHRAPDLWIEVDLFSTSVPREPIYSRLGVPEVWRYKADRLAVRLLTDAGVYADSATSKALAFLPMADLAGFIPRMLAGDRSRVLLEFREWVRGLPE